MSDPADALRPIGEYRRFISDWRVGDRSVFLDALHRSLKGASIRR